MKNKDKASQIILSSSMILLCILIVIPFWILVSVSFSSESDISYYGYRLIPKTFDLSAYRYVFKNASGIFDAYKITALFSVMAMVLGVVLMSMIAYPLSRRSFSKRRVISFVLYFTMLFSGGLVPSYILITNYLHLDNTIWVYILPSAVNVWHVFMIRTFFQGIPEPIIESAYIDGASELRIFATIILPLSKPCLATVALLTFLSKWNDWYTSMLYIDKQSLISLQYLLQRIMNNIKILQENQNIANEVVSAKDLPAESARMAMAVVVAGPALVVFPFFQKYFVKGLTLGSVKG